MLRLGLAGFVAGQMLDPFTWNTNFEEMETKKLHAPFLEPLAESKFNKTSLCDKVDNYAGQLSFKGLDDEKKSFFFWLFESRSDPKKDPLVLWLSGGPGCSSSMALLFENGPCKAIHGAETETNPHSWNNKANVIWVDQPAGTGFSKGKMVADEKGVAEDMYGFLQEFYKQFPQYASNPFYVTGESYAGHYIPAVSHRVWKGNKDGNGVKIPLAGLAIGNGLTDPEHQYPEYPHMGFDGGKDQGGSLEKGVFSAFEKKTMEYAVPVCVKQINACNQGQSAACQSALVVCNLALMTPYQMKGYNPYDMRIKCESPPLCYDFTKETAFMNDPEVQKQLGVTEKWETCNMMVNMGMRGDWMLHYQQDLPELLADGIRVLIYAGDVDYICNWLGNKKWVLALDFDGKEEFRQAEDKDYVVNNEKAGRIRTAHGLSFLQIYNAGHMVPMDKPEAALQMINDFISSGFEATVTKPAQATVQKPESKEAVKMIIA